MNRTLVALLGLIATAVLGLAFFVYQARLTAPVELALQTPESVQAPAEEAAVVDRDGLSLRLSTTLASVPTTRPAPKLSAPAQVPPPARGLTIAGTRLSLPVLFSGMFLLLSGLLGAWVAWNFSGRAAPVTGFIDDSHSELGGRLSAQEAVIEQLREELGSWKTSAEQLREANDEQSRTMEQLRAELAAAPEVEESPPEQLERISELEQTLDKQRAELAAAQSVQEMTEQQLAHVSELEETLDQLRAELAEAQAAQEMTEQQLEHVSWLEQKLEAFSDQEQRLEQWQSTVATLQSEVRGKSTLIDSLHDRITAAQEKEVEAQYRLATMDEAQANIAELERQNEFLSDEVRELRELGETLQRGSEENVGKLRDALVSVESLEAEKQVLTDKVGELEAERETARTATQALAELERDFAEAQAEGVRAREELALRQQEIADLEQARMDSAQRVAELEDLLSSREQALRGELGDVRGDMESLRVELNSTRSDLEEALASLARRENELLERDHAIAALNAQVDGEELRLREATAARDALVIDLEQEREALRQQVGELEQALEVSAEEARTLREGQDSRSHELQARLSAKNAVVVELKDEIQALKQRVEEAQLAAGEPIARLEALQDELVGSQRRVAELEDGQQRLVDFENISAEKDATIAKLDSKLQKAVQKTETLEADIERLRDFENIAGARDEKISDLEQRLEERENEIDLLDLEVQRLRQVEMRQQELAEQTGEVQTGLIQKSAEVERLQGELEQRDAGIRALEQELQRLAELEQLAATRADKILELENELSGRTDIINTQQTDLSRLRRVEDVAPELEARVRELEGRLTQETVDNEALRSQLEERNRALTDLAEQYAQLRDSAETGGATGQLHVVQSELADKNSRLQELEAGIRNRDDELAVLQNRLLILEEAKDEYTPKLERQGQKLARLEAELDDARKNLRDLYQENERLAEFERLAESRGEKISVLKADIDKTASHFGEMKKQVEEARKAKFEVREREARLSQLKSELMSRDQRIRELQERLVALGDTDSRLSAWQSTVETYRNDLETKARIIDQQREEIDELRSLHEVIRDKEKSISTLVTALKHDSRNIEKLKRRILRWKRRAAMLENKLRGTDPSIRQVVKDGAAVASAGGEAQQQGPTITVTVDKPTLTSADLEELSTDPDISGINPELAESESGIIPRPAGEAPQWLNNPPDGEPDDLTELSGVNNKLSGLLNDAGVFHYRQIARFTRNDLEWLNHIANPLPEPLLSNKWISHAKVLHYKKYKRPA